jgi:hypothetical protein
MRQDPQRSPPIGSPNGHSGQTKKQQEENQMSINNDSDVYAPTTEGGYGPGWVWGGGDAGWSYLGTSEGDAGTSPLAQTLIAGLQQQQSPLQEDWFAQANSMAVAAMVNAQMGEAAAPVLPQVLQNEPPAPSESLWQPINQAGNSNGENGWVWGGGDAGWLYQPNHHIFGSPDSAYTPPAQPAADPYTLSGNPAQGWVWGGGDAGWSYLPSPEQNNPFQYDTLSTAVATALSEQHPTAPSTLNLAAAGAAGALVQTQFLEQTTIGPTDKSPGTIKTDVPNNNPATVRTAPAPSPQERTGPLWAAGPGAASVAAIWGQTQADPYRLMQNMTEYGISAQELAQASGQSLDDINLYLSRAGAPVGFAGGDIIDRQAVDAAFIAALDAASQPLTAQGAGSNFDVNAFSAWYAAQDSQASRDFARLHGAHFSHSQAYAMAGHWEGNGDAGEWVWRGAQIARQGQTDASQNLITSYLSYSQASPQELQAVDYMLSDQINQELLAHFGSSAELPHSEYVERMRARYGSERATQMWRIQEASAAVRAAYAAAIDEQQNNPPLAQTLQDQGVGVVLDSQNTRYDSSTQPWWSVNQHIEYDNNHSTVHFDLQRFTTWYASQDSAASRLFNQLYGSQITTVEHAENRGEGDIERWSNRYIGAGGASEVLMGGWQATGDQSQTWASAAATGNGINASVIAMDPTQGEMQLFDASAISFDPVMGFITANDNIDNSEWTDMILPVLIGAAAGAFLGPAAAQAAGFTAGTTAGTIAAAGFGGAIGTAFSGMVANGRIDFEQVLKGALTAVLTAGFAEVTGANQAGLLTDAHGNVVLIDGVSVVTNWGSRIAAMGGQAAFSGLVSDLMGGDFSQGFVQSLAGQLGREIMNAVGNELRTNTTLSAQEQAAYNLMGRSLSAALTIAANPDNPMQALALSFIGSIGTGLGNELGGVNPAANGVGNIAANGNAATPSTTPSTPSTHLGNTPVNGLTEDDGWALVGGGQGGFSGSGTNTDNSISGQYNYNNGVPPGPNLRWTDAGWQPIEAVGGGVQEGMVASAGAGQTQPGPGASTGAPSATSGTGGAGGTSGANSPLTPEQQVRLQGALVQEGITPLNPSTFMGPPTEDQAEFLNTFGVLLNQGDLDRLNGADEMFGGLFRVMFEGYVLNGPQVPGGRGAGVNLAGTGALPWTLGTLAAGGSRVLVAGAELLADLALTARGLAPWTLLLVPGNAQEQIVNIDEGQRFVTRPGELYGSLQQLGPDGQWFTSASGVALVDMGGGQRVALTPEQLAELNRPIGTPIPPPPPILLGRPIDQPQQPIIETYPAPTQPAGPVVETYPMPLPPDWRDLIVESSGQPPVPGATPGRETSGRSQLWEANGGMSAVDGDFDSLNPENIRTYPNGMRIGTMPDGRTVIVRPNSSDGRPTLEIQNDRGQIKIRYNP